MEAIDSTSRTFGSYAQVPDPPEPALSEVRQAPSRRGEAPGTRCGTCYDRPYAVGSAARPARLAGTARTADAPQRRRLDAADRRLRNRRIATSSPPELPGLARDQIELALEDIRVSRSAAGAPIDAASGAEAVHYHQVERGHGAFARTFEFADKIDVDGVTADLTDGVLTVTLPKLPPPPRRTIEVR